MSVWDSLVGQKPVIDSVDLPPLYGLALVGAVAAQLPEVVAACKGQLGARDGMLRGSLCGGAGKPGSRHER